MKLLKLPQERRELTVWPAVFLQFEPLDTRVILTFASTEDAKLAANRIIMMVEHEQLALRDLIDRKENEIHLHGKRAVLEQIERRLSDVSKTTWSEPKDHATVTAEIEQKAFEIVSE